MARFYDPEIVTWNVIGPLAVNNPIRFIDPDGMRVANPRDKFKTIEDAAKDFGKY